MSEQFKGSGVALVTPFNKNHEIDYSSLGKILEHTGKNGIDYFVILGSTGEAPTVTFEERQDIIKFTVDHNAYHLPVVVGFGGNDTHSLTKEIKSTDLSGVDAILVSNPPYNKPSQEGLYRHYNTVADHSPVPVILYNVPGRTACNMEAETTINLSRHGNIKGIKEASGDLGQCMKIINEVPDDFLVISGDDLFTLPLLSIGGHGVISVLANAYPQIFRQITHSALIGDFDAARKAIYKIININPLMYHEGSPTGVKQALKIMQLCENYVRLPLVSASDDLYEEIVREVDRMRKY